MALASLAGCGSGASPSSTPYALQARLGTYDDGSGRVGLAALATLRDGAGAGPATPWSAWLTDPAGTLASAEYAGSGPGSYASWWWPGIAVQDGAAYALHVDGGSGALQASLTGSTAGGLALPAPVLAADASRIDWAPVPGAAAYACRVYTAGALQLDAASATPGCDLSTLPPGGYQASVLAFSANVAAIAANTSQRPALPDRFDVSEARLGVVRTDGTTAPQQLLAAGGAFDFGQTQRGLAVWVSLRKADGSATDRAWTVSIVGPGIPSASPVTFQYPASMPRQMNWSYDVPATPGTYTMTATSGTTAVSTTFAVGSPASIAFVVDPSATPGTAGSAQMTWSTVAGARAYLVEVWDHAAGVRAQSMWVPAPPAKFPDGTFTSGRTYDVYVAATDAGMSGATTPTQVAVSEYPSPFTSFVE
ncbi:MAG TPA: hypothetical protein VFP50_02660 [Anaeromyxobacteraceae bacterium]|nr:hypothetical protein [Anaeromyxobacteraceae bacterium]